MSAAGQNVGIFGALGAKAGQSPHSVGLWQDSHPRIPFKINAAVPTVANDVMSAWQG
jgi:hypothetical protein